MASKSERELAALRLIYEPPMVQSAQSGDKPDLVLRSAPASPPFGVEVTEIHASDSAARLTHLPGYAVSLLDGGSTRHRSDSSILIDDVEFTSKDGQVIRGRALQQDSLTIAEFLERLAATIEDKNEKARSYDPQLSHINLIIIDHARPFILQNADVTNALILSEAVQRAALYGSFNEVFVVTRISDEHQDGSRAVYLPLRQLTLTSLLFQFPSALASFAPGHRFGSSNDLIAALGSYLVARGLAVRIRSLAGRTELVIGTIGISRTDEPQVFVNDYLNAPALTTPCEPVTDNSDPWCTAPFENHFSEHRLRHTVRLSCIFPVKQST